MAHFFNLKGFLEEFKAFALKGNVIDLAVAVVIGGAFNKIVSVFVSSIITPIIGYLTSGVNLAYLVLKLGDVELKYGELLQATIDFLIIAFSVFVAIKLIGALRRGPCTSLLDCFQNWISHMFRLYHPLPGMACSRGESPVT